MIQTKDAEAAPSQQQGMALLEETARAVKVMKASWLRVALNLQRIREHEIWRLHSSSCESFEDYVYGVLDIQRAVAKRMMDAVSYTQSRRPGFVDDVISDRDGVHVPSYDVLNQLRRAEPQFEGREEEFAELETKVFDERLGRARLKQEIDEVVEGPAPEIDPTQHEEQPAPEPVLDLASLLDELKVIEKKMLQLEVSKEARQLMFQLVETLQREKSGARAART